jgi:hypothetical protein
VEEMDGPEEGFHFKGQTNGTPRFYAHPPLHVSPLLFPFHPPLFVALSNVLGKMAKTKSRAMGEKNGARPHIPSNTKRMRKANGWIYIGNRFVA